MNSEVLTFDGATRIELFGLGKNDLFWAPGTWSQLKGLEPIFNRKKSVTLDVRIGLA